jgi:transposase
MATRSSPLRTLLNAIADRYVPVAGERGGTMLISAQGKTACIAHLTVHNSTAEANALRQGMPLVSEIVHPRGLDFANRRKVVLLRDTKGLSWRKITQRVRNLKGGRPGKDLVKAVYKDFEAPAARKKYAYKNCGRRPWKITKKVESYLLLRLRALRRVVVCTSATLQREVWKKHGVDLDESTICKVLKRNKYAWLPRCQKRKYTAAVMKARLAFAHQVLQLRPGKLREKLSFAMDGVVLAMPPADLTARQNHCRYGDAYMWRKKNEAAMPELAGESSYGTQVPLARALPLWGGISAGGFAPVAFHKSKKLTSEEWVNLVEEMVWITFA